MEPATVIRDYLEQANPYLQDGPSTALDAATHALTKLTEHEFRVGLMAELDAIHLYERLDAARLLLHIGVGLDERSRVISVISDALQGVTGETEQILCSILLQYPSLPEDLTEDIAALIASSVPIRQLLGACLGSRTDSLLLESTELLRAFVIPPDDGGRGLIPEFREFAATELLRLGHSEVMVSIIDSATTPDDIVFAISRVGPDFPHDPVLERRVKEVIEDERHTAAAKRTAITALLHVAASPQSARETLLPIVSDGEWELLAEAVHAISTLDGSFPQSCISKLLGHLASDDLRVREASALSLHAYVPALNRRQATRLCDAVMRERDIVVLQLLLRASRSFGEVVTGPLMQRIDMAAADIRTIMILTYLFSLDEPSREELHRVLHTPDGDEPPDYMTGLMSGLIGSFRKELAFHEMDLQTALHSADELTRFKSLACLLSSPDAAASLTAVILDIFLTDDELNRDIAKAVLLQIGYDVLADFPDQTALSDEQAELLARLRSDLESPNQTGSGHALSWMTKSNHIKHLRRFVLIAEYIERRPDGVSFAEAARIAGQELSQQEQDDISVSNSSLRMCVPELQAELSRRLSRDVELTYTKGKKQLLTDDGRKLYEDGREYLEVILGNR